MNGNSRNIDWYAIEEDYIHDTRTTMAALAQKYDVPESTLYGHAKRHRWTEARDIYRAKVEARMIEATAPKNAVTRLGEINAKQLRWNEEMRFAINTLLKKRLEDGRVVLRDWITLNDVSRAIAAYAELYRLDRLALGASTENLAPATVRDRFDEMSDDELLEELKRVRGRLTVN